MPKYPLEKKAAEVEPGDILLIGSDDDQQLVIVCREAGPLDPMDIAGFITVNVSERAHPTFETRWSERHQTFTIPLGREGAYVADLGELIGIHANPGALSVNTKAPLDRYNPSVRVAHSIAGTRVFDELMERIALQMYKGELNPADAETHIDIIEATRRLSYPEVDPEKAIMAFIDALSEHIIDNDISLEAARDFNILTPADYQKLKDFRGPEQEELKGIMQSHTLLRDLIDNRPTGELPEIWAKHVKRISDNAYDYYDITMNALVELQSLFPDQFDLRYSYKNPKDDSGGTPDDGPPPQ